MIVCLLVDGLTAEGLCCIQCLVKRLGEYLWWIFVAVLGLGNTNYTSNMINLHSVSETGYKMCHSHLPCDLPYTMIFSIYLFVFTLKVGHAYSIGPL